MTVEFAWVEDLEAYCFTAIHGLRRLEVVRRLGGDPRGEDRLTFEQCFWTLDEPQWVQIGEVGAAVLVAEHNGWRADEAVEVLSAGARLVCFYRNVNAVMRFVYAVDGAVLADFDPLLDARPAAGGSPRALDRFLTGLPFGLHAAEPSAMALLERVTGVKVTPAWLDQPQPAYELPPLT